METINPIVCNTMLKALPSNETHVEYCLPAPTMAPYAPAKDKIILHVQKVNEPEKILYLKVPQEENYARCQKEEFSKTPEGTILEALDMNYHLSSSPTPIQNYCKQNKDGRVIPITEKIKTRSDVKSHDERYIREETDRTLELLKKLGIGEGGNWYGAEKPVSKQFNIPKVSKGNKQYTLKKPMTLKDLKDLPQENHFVQEDTQRVPQVAQKVSLRDKDKDT